MWIWVVPPANELVWIGDPDVPIGPQQPAPPVCKSMSLPVITPDVQVIGDPDVPVESPINVPDAAVETPMFPLMVRVPPELMEISPVPPVSVLLLVAPKTVSPPAALKLMPAPPVAVWFSVTVATLLGTARLIIPAVVTSRLGAEIAAAWVSCPAMLMVTAPVESRLLIISGPATLFLRANVLLVPPVRFAANALNAFPVWFSDTGPADVTVSMSPTIVELD